MYKNTLILLSSLLLLGCTHHQGVGKYANSEQRFDANVTHFWYGGASIEFQKRDQNVHCSGKALLIEPKTTCAGQKGTFHASCSDSTILDGTWVSTSCVTGTGEGFNKKNEKFIFNFGYSSDEAERMLIIKEKIFFKQ